MQQNIQFNTSIENGIIRIPKKFTRIIPKKANITIIPTYDAKPKYREKTSKLPPTIEDFPAVIDTRGWRFNRDEAHER